MMNDTQLAKSEDSVTKNELYTEPPSLFLYLSLITFAILLIFGAFLSEVDLPSLFLNLATEIIGAVIILMLVERKLRKTEIEYLRGTSQRVIDTFPFNPSIRQIRSYLKKSGLNMQRISDTFYYSRPSIEKQISSANKCYILEGDAGIGKTMLLNKHFLNLVKKAYQNPGKAKIPVYISLFHKWNSDLHTSILDAMQYYAKVSQRTFKRLLKQGKIICILDGLDEVFDNNEIISEINRFHSQYPQIQIIVATRPYIINQSLEDFSIISIPNFSEEETKQYQDIIKKYMQENRTDID
jgi:predicted NACHT family NTPase